jgi:hypothetical protein
MSGFNRRLTGYAVDLLKLVRVLVKLQVEVHLHLITSSRDGWIHCKASIIRYKLN